MIEEYDYLPEGYGKFNSMQDYAINIIETLKSESCLYSVNKNKN